ncbi:hypothetical protein F5879DRAFT_923067 [Lentinula edodes]|nr:hypothetical protein F5879DRAFT_923067 [Lentinula edodes]
MFIDLTNGNAWNERTYKQMKMPKITASPSRICYAVLDSGDGDGGREEGSKAASRWSSTHRSLLTSFVAHLAESGQNSAPGGVKGKAAKILSPRFPNEKSLAFQNTLLAWDTVEGTYQGAQLTGSFTDGVWYLGKKVVGGVDGERGLTVDERVKLGIGMSFADVEARGRMRSIRNTWEMRMHVSLVPLASAAVAHFLLAEAVFLDLFDDPGCEVRGKRGNSCGG